MNNLLGAYTPVFFSRCVPPQIRSNNIPESFDWNSLGYVTSAKSQLSCASCFVFAAIATVESAYLIKNRGRFCSKNVDFSEQAVLNCMQAASCQTGGQVTAAWQFMQKNGLVDEIDAPYLSGQQFCNISSHRRLSYHKLQIRDFCQSFYNEEITMQQLILANGPIFVGIDIRDRFEWIHVKGVFKGRCGKSPNHAVIITGWTKNYWIIKNSWGRSWGKNGFLYLPRHTNECGVNNVIGLARLN
ncbi:hypothetical protein NH340_JMT06877 [Sarcoptes scabiei]|nr:hypothetical protein NH340_JMT06877 [Sarcoptes scabiei]